MTWRIVSSAVHLKPSYYEMDLHNDLTGEPLHLWGDSIIGALNTISDESLRNELQRAVLDMFIELDVRLFERDFDEMLKEIKETKS